MRMRFLERNIRSTMCFAKTMRSNMTQLRQQSLFGSSRMNANYDPDGGYWDMETDSWIKYDDMEEL